MKQRGRRRLTKQRRCHPRFPLQQEFRRWYRGHRGQILAPVELVRKSRSHLHAHICGYGNCLRADINRHCLDVCAVLGDECIDVIASFEAEPAPASGGYTCRLCHPGARKRYRSRAALWHAHVFEPFRRWLNEKLAGGEPLHLYRGDGFDSASFGPMQPGLRDCCVTVLARDPAR
jgi:hypothetical protein